MDTWIVSRKPIGVYRPSQSDPNALEVCVCVSDYKLMTMILTYISSMLSFSTRVTSWPAKSPQHQAYKTLPGLQNKRSNKKLTESIGRMSRICFQISSLPCAYYYYDIDLEYGGRVASPLRFGCSNPFSVLACFIESPHNNFALGGLANMFGARLDLVRKKRQSSSTFHSIHCSIEKHMSMGESQL